MWAAGVFVVWTSREIRAAVMPSRWLQRSFMKKMRKLSVGTKSLEAWEATFWLYGSRFESPLHFDSVCFLVYLSMPRISLISSLMVFLIPPLFSSCFHCFQTAKAKKQKKMYYELLVHEIRAGRSQQATDLILLCKSSLWMTLQSGAWHQQGEEARTGLHAEVFNKVRRWGDFKWECREMLTSFKRPAE